MLYEPSAADSLPGTRAALDYFRDDTLSKRLGHIDLTHCEEVLSSLDSSLYQHLFALRTKHKGHDRVYYLAADNEPNMNKWVNSLCCVLGLKENDDDEKPPLSHDRPPPTQTLHAPAQQGQTISGRPRTPLPTPVSALRSSPLPARAGSLSNLPSARSGSYGLSSSTTRTSNPHLNSSPHHGSGSLRQTGILKSSPLSASPASSNQGSRGEGYIPLDECYSDDQAKRRSPLDIVPPAPLDRDAFPSEPAPLPPVKSGQQGAPPRCMDRVDSEMYDYPKRYININQDNGEYSYPPRRRESTDDGDDGLYKVPPVHRLRIISQTSSIYKVPPPRHMSPTSPNNANGWYDVPPIPHSKSQRNSSGTAERRASDTNNLREMLSTKVSVEPRTSRWAPGDDTYDVPPTATKSVSENNLLDCVPPPRAVNRGGNAPVPPDERTNSRYMNLPSNSKVHPGYVAPPPVTDSVYDFPRHIQDSDMLEMTPPPPQPCTLVKHRYVNAPPGYVVDPDTEGMYMPMAVHASNDDLYLPMDSQVTAPRPLRGEDDTLYSYPSSNQPIGPHSVPPSGGWGVPPMMLPKQVTISVPVSDGRTDRTEDNIISHTRRTKSFKRNIECPYKDEVILPTKKSGQDSQSSSDDETDSVSSHDRSLDNLDMRMTEQTLEQQFAQMKSLNSTPPPPTSKRPGEVQYLDLDLDTNRENSEAEKSPIFPKSLGVRCVTPTDYKEIDFIKTKALNDMKKDLEKKRKSSEKSVDE